MFAEGVVMGFVNQAFADRDLGLWATETLDEINLLLASLDTAFVYAVNGIAGPNSSPPGDALVAQFKKDAPGTLTALASGGMALLALEKVIGLVPKAVDVIQDVLRRAKGEGVLTWVSDLVAASEVLDPLVYDDRAATLTDDELRLAIRLQERVLMAVSLVSADYRRSNGQDLMLPEYNCTKAHRFTPPAPGQSENRLIEAIRSGPLPEGADFTCSGKHDPDIAGYTRYSNLAAKRNVVHRTTKCAAVYQTGWYSLVSKDEARYSQMLPCHVCEQKLTW
jgi:hypothetical protein